MAIRSNPKKSPVESEVEDFRRTREIKTKFFLLLSSFQDRLESLQQKSLESLHQEIGTKLNNFCPSNILLQLNLSLDWLSVFTLEKIVVILQSPECTAALEEYKATVKTYLINRSFPIQGNNYKLFAVRTDSAWDLELTEITPMSVRIVHILELDTQGTKPVGELKERNLIIHFKPEE